MPTSKNGVVKPNDDRHAKLFRQANLGLFPSLSARLTNTLSRRIEEGLTTTPADPSLLRLGIVSAGIASEPEVRDWIKETLNELFGQSL